MLITTITKEWLPLIILGFNAALFLVIKFNDMKHIDNAVKKIQEVTEKSGDKIDALCERVAKIEGKCQATHGEN